MTVLHRPHRLPGHRVFKKQMSGFTLLEVLVALAILALSSMAISRQISNGLQQQQQLQLKDSAKHIAENEVSLLLLMPDWPALGGDSRQLRLLGREWEVGREISSTSEPLLRKLVITVSLAEHSDQSLFSLVAYRGRH